MSSISWSRPAPFLGLRLRTQRLELRLAEYEDEILRLDIPPEHVALFEPADDDGGVEHEALEILCRHGLLQPASNGKGFVYRKPGR